MNYQILQPTIPLAPFVKEIGVISCRDGMNKNHIMKFFADGCPGIIYGQSAHDLILNPVNKKLATIYLHGQTIKPIEIVAKGSFTMIVFFLYPHVVKSLFGFNAHEITNDCIDLKLIDPTLFNTVTEQLLDDVELQDQINIISNYILNRIRRKNLEIDPILHFATHQMIKNNGDISIYELYTTLKLSERTLERKFMHHVGMSPRMFARICKFQSTLNQLNTDSYSKLTDVAYDNGFTDQSHLIKTFKEFTGLTPTDYLVLNTPKEPIIKETTIF